MFYSLGTSYGTQGIITRLAVRVEAAHTFVHVRYMHFECLSDCARSMEAMSNLGQKEAPLFIDGIALGLHSCVAVIGTPCDTAPIDTPMMSLRGKRSDPWFFWHVTDLSRRIETLPKDKVQTDYREKAGHSEYMTLDDFLFRFDRGAFWMARLDL